MVNIFALILINNHNTIIVSLLLSYLLIHFIESWIDFGIFSIFKEIIKFLLLKIVGKNYFFKIIYFFKYDRLNLDELKNLNFFNN